LDALIAEQRFRLVDVTTGEVIVVQEAQEPPMYVALSCVWGQTATSISSFVRVDPDHKRSVLLQRASATIRDCAHLVDQLNMRYIWVDQICIHQDSSSDKASIVTRMGAIYGMATLTVIAASGADAHAGLIGLHPRQRSGEIEMGFVHREVQMSVLPRGIPSTILWHARNGLLVDGHIRRDYYHLAVSSSRMMKSCIKMATMMSARPMNMLKLTRAPS
jgi:hypothetical protein